MGTLNMGTIKTPGVYIDEMSLFPPSVAQVETAVPAFIGPTEISGPAVNKTPTRISSMAEYRQLFGGAPDREVTVLLNEANAVKSVIQGTTNAPAQYLHDSLLLFFGNGGNKCYIVSTGRYLDTPNQQDYKDCLDALKKYDEPTLIVAPDAVRSTSVAGIQKDMLEHCNIMQDRFAILDVAPYLADATAQPAISPTQTTIGTSFERFRTGVGNQYLNYGAAYFPFLQTSIPVSITYPSLAIKRAVGGGDVTMAELVSSVDPARPAADTMLAVKDDAKKVTDVAGNIVATDYVGKATIADKKAYLQDRLYAFYNPANANFTGTPTIAGGNKIASETALNDLTLRAAYVTYRTSTLFTQLKTDIEGIVTSGQTASTPGAVDALYTRLTNYLSNFVDTAQQRLKNAEVELRSKSPVYAAIAAAAETQALVLPPSGAVAGVYARTDADRGVWKSPANTSLNYVTAPKVALIDAEQDGMNVDTDGKSVNAIRAFSGKGTLVWGARTLAGNSAEWRYVSVRRFFIMAEESIRKATAQFVFEANDANTWVRLRAMIENFLTLQWRAGALAGAKAEQAFFVRVGLGQTMTPQDVLDGFMIIEIGMAVVRPAEFIVLRFSHKMQQA